MYRRTSRYEQQRSQQAARNRAQRLAKDAKRLAAATSEPAQDYPQPLPDLRMRITIERFDFGHVTHVLEGYKTRRVDLLRWVADGAPMATCGLSKALALLRKATPRVMSDRAL